MDIGNDDERFREKVEKQARRIARAKGERRGVLAQTAYLGVLGLVLVLPVVAGAYVGRWLDGMADGYSTRWTLSLIFVGVVAGALNAYFLLRS